MPRAALPLLLLALAGPAQAAPAAAPPAVAADPAITATPQQAVPPTLSQARPDPGGAPPAAGPAAIVPGQALSYPAGLPAPPPDAGAVTIQPGTGQPGPDHPATGEPFDRPAAPPGAPPAAGQPGGLESGARPPGAADAMPSGPAGSGHAAGGGAGVAPPVLPLPPATARLAVSGVLGRTVDGPDRQDIGRVVDVLVDGRGQPRAAVIDFGGFMGLGSRKIAVEWDAFAFPPSGSDAVLTIVLSPEQIKDAPEYAGPGRPVTVVGPGTPVPRPGP